MVTNSCRTADAIAEGPDGILAGLAPGKILIDMSTVSPAVSRALAAKVREKGADMVDSPVSGSVITLQEGKLSVMVGGRRETFERVQSRFSRTIGPKVTYVGDNGLALAMKIATNLSLAVQMLAFSRRRSAGREKRHRARDRGGRADAQRHRLAHGPIPRAVCVENAGRSLVQRQHDAEGHAAGAGNGAATRCSAADDGRHE